MKARGNERRGASGAAWSYIAGDKGRNRVRVFERGERSSIWIDYRDEQGKRVRQPLGHVDRERAKLAADELVVRFRRHDTAPAPVLTLRALIDMYEREVTPRKSATAQAHDRRTLPLFVHAFGGARRPSTLNRRDWDSYIQRRQRGDVAPPGCAGHAVRTRVLEQDVSLLNAVLNWATRAGSGGEGYLLERNPFAGLHTPREECPRRPMLSRAQYEQARAAAAGMAMHLECFVVLAWFTGHRSQSIRLLRWSDIDLERARIHWRGENDKIGYDHWNPLHPEAAAIVKQLQTRAGAIGDAWVFPAARRPTEPMSNNAAVNYWKRIAERAGIPKGQRYGWHSFRRAFANNLRDVALRDLKDLGGWKSARTVVQVYQQPSEEAQRRGLEGLGQATGADSTEQRAPATGTSAD